MKSKASFFHGYRLLVLFGLALLFSYTFFLQKQKTFSLINSFEDCYKAGYPIRETYPEECVIPGKRFVNPSQQQATTTEEVISTSYDYKNATYFMEGQSLAFIQGLSKLPENKLVDRSLDALKIIDPPISLDINDDKKDDTVFFLESRDKEGNAIYYVSAYMSLHTGFTGVNILALDQNIGDMSYAYEGGLLSFIYKKNNATTTKSFIVRDSILSEIIK